MRRAKLALTSMDASATREEAFMSNMADWLPGVGQSAYAYTGFLNRLRADLFDHLLDVGAKQGIDTDEIEFLRETGRIVNVLTGRGSAGDHELAMKSLSVLFFSPRLIAARLNMLFRAFNPMTHAAWLGVGSKSKRVARQEASRAMASFLGTGTAVLFLADKLPGVEVGLDPRSSDFGKIQIGDTRLDIWGGFQQYIVLASRMVSGEKTMSDTGEVRNLEAYGKGRIFGSAEDFFANKLAPNPAYFYAWDQAGPATGRTFDPKVELGKLMLPIGIESAIETGIENDYGVRRTALEFLANFVGLGTNTYGTNAPRGGALVDPFGGTSGVDPFSGSGGVNPFGG
jgi:hypothetical protein